MVNNLNELPKFDLFIAYSTNPDYYLSRRVESFLESFHLKIQNKDYHINQLQVCRDGSDFQLHKILREARNLDKDQEVYIQKAITQYLKSSKNLLVLCSRNSAKSKYVQFEVDWFLKNKPEGNIYLAVTEGRELEHHTMDLFPPSIISQNFPYHLSLDFRGLKKESRDWINVKESSDEMVSLASQLNNYTRGELFPIYQREKEEQLKKERNNLIWQRSILTLVAITAIIGGTLSLVFWKRTQAVLEDRSKALVQERNTRFLLHQNQAIVKQKAGLYRQSLLHISEAIAANPNFEKLVEAFFSRLKNQNFFVAQKYQSDIIGILINKFSEPLIIQKNGKVLTQGYSNSYKLANCAPLDPINLHTAYLTEKNTLRSINKEGKLIDYQFSENGSNCTTNRMGSILPSDNFRVWELSVGNNGNDIYCIGINANRSQRKEVYYYDLKEKTSKPFPEFSEPDHIHLSNDGKYLAVASGKSVQILETTSNTILPGAHTELDLVNTMCIRKGGDFLLSGGMDQKLIKTSLADYKNGSVKKLKEWKLGSILQTCIQLGTSPYFAIGLKSGTVRILDLEYNFLLDTQLKHEFPINQLVFDTISNSLIVGTEENIIQKWDLSHLFSQDLKLENEVYRGVFKQEEKAPFSFEKKEEIIFNSDKREPIHNQKGLPIFSIDHSKEQIAIAFHDSIEGRPAYSVSIFDMVSLKKLTSIAIESKPLILSLNIQGNTSNLYIARKKELENVNSGFILESHSLNSNQESKLILDTNNLPTDYYIVPELIDPVKEQLIATTGWNGQFPSTYSFSGQKIIHHENGFASFLDKQGYRSLENFNTSITAIAWSPDGEYLVLGYIDGSFLFLDSESGEVIGNRHELGDGGNLTKRVNDITFNLQGDIVAIGGDGGIARVLNLETQKVIAPDLVHEGPIHTVSLNKSGSKLLAYVRTRRTSKTGQVESIAKVLEWDIASSSLSKEEIHKDLNYYGEVIYNPRNDIFLIDSKGFRTQVNSLFRTDLSSYKSIYSWIQDDLWWYQDDDGSNEKIKDFQHLVELLLGQKYNDTTGVINFYYPTEEEIEQAAKKIAPYGEELVRFVRGEK